MNQDDESRQLAKTNTVNDERNVTDIRNQLQKTQKQLRFVKIVVIILFFTVFAIVFMLGYVAKAVYQKTPEGREAQMSKETQRFSDSFQVINAQIVQIQSVIRASGQTITQIQEHLHKPASSSQVQLSSTQLSNYVKQGFTKIQKVISFFHMHNSETYFYQRVAKYLRYLDTDFLKQNLKARTAFMLAANNYKLPHTNAPFQRALETWLRKDYERLSKEYDFNLQELPFCIVVPTLNNAKDFRYEYNLQSIINLDYKNFKIVIVDDASTDHTYELIKLWIENNNITQDIVVLTNEKRMTAVPNIHRAITQHCSADSIVALVDGDDELLGRYSLKVFNHIYQKQKADVVYSSHIQLNSNIIKVKKGWSKEYFDEQKSNNWYRDVPQKIAHLRSFKAKLYLKIKEADLKDDKGEWLASTYDEVICLPILEMSCGRIVYIQEFFYLYNSGIGTNDLQVDPKLQKNIADYVKYQKPKYQCVND